MEQIKKENRGGKRIGAGHPFKYGEKTINITFRIPTSHKQLIKAMVKEYLDKVSAEYKSSKPTKSEHYGC
jgi:basic membrane lipoprotein Med (substrate-binding protein (PBP1-ABC) superfamily)